MANVEHSALTDPNIHEPKGIVSAADKAIYVANGSSSGNWVRIQDFYNIAIDDVSTAGTVYIPVPYAGEVLKVTAALSAPISSANATLTVRDAAGSSMGDISLPFSGSAAGDTGSLAPVSNNSILDDSFVTIETDGGSTGTVKVWITLVMSRL